MLIPALLFLLLLLLALFGWIMLCYICARRDLPEGWACPHCGEGKDKFIEIEV